MFKPSTRSRSRSRSLSSVQPAAGFAETQFLHGEGDEDYSGFAPTQMFDDERRAPRRGERRAVPRSEGRAPAEENAMPASWVTSRWVEEQEARAHDAADQARAVIAAQRRASGGAANDERAGWMRRLRLAVQRVLPFDFPSVLPLFICVSLTMALISAVLPLFDKP